MSDIIGGRGNKNANCVRIIKPNFYNDCAYFNTKTQRCEKHGYYCKGYIAKKCTDNTVPKNYEYEKRYKIPKEVSRTENSKITTSSMSTTYTKIVKLPLNRTFVDALYSGALGKIKRLPYHLENDMKKTKLLVQKCAENLNLSINYNLTKIPQQIINNYGETITIGDVIEIDKTNNIRAFVLQFLNGNVMLITINRKFLTISYKNLKKSKRINY